MSVYRVLLWAMMLSMPLLVHAQAPAPPAPGLRAFEPGSLQAIREAHVGRPFVLALWSVYCEPCRAEMTTLGRFKAEYPQAAMVLVSIDPPDELPAVQRMLAQYAPVGAETWAFADAFAERLRYAVDPRWRGELPRTYFYDAEHRVSAVSGSVDAATLSAWMQGSALPR